MIKLPELTIKLKKRICKSDRDDKPKQKVKKIEFIRTKVKKNRLHWEISMEYQFHDKWYIFRINEEPVVFMTTAYSIHGIAFSDTRRVRKVISDIKSWLKEWMKENNVKWFKKEDEEIEEKKPKVEEPIKKKEEPKDDEEESDAQADDDAPIHPPILV
jgi:glutamyl/glutaminyl-tRNA synthetase